MYVDVFTLGVFSLIGALNLISLAIIVMSICGIISTYCEVKESKLKSHNTNRKEED